MSTKSFISEAYEIPQVLETSRMRLRMLTVSDVVKDYDAVISSEAHLLKTKPFGPNQTWPNDLTLEQNLIDLGWHQKEFQRKSSFAYTVMNLDEDQCLGCIYINPSTNSNYEAMVVLWVRQSELENGLDQHLYESVKKWITEKWSFKTVAYPGREISWDAWSEAS